jgi:hypothetical protein
MMIRIRPSFSGGGSDPVKSGFTRGFSSFSNVSFELTANQLYVSTSRITSMKVQINYLAVLAAAVSAFVIGGMWYSPLLFANAWMRETGLREQELAQRNMAKIFGTAFVLSMIIALNLAAFLSGPADWKWGMTAGALAGIGWVATAMAITYLFEGRSMKLFPIDAGYQAVALIVMGAILGAWK